MLSQHRRPNRLVLDSGSVTHRVAALRRRVGSRVKIFAALKADGYASARCQWPKRRWPVARMRCR
jgi:alanine racemase